MTSYVGTASCKARHGCMPQKAPHLRMNRIWLLCTRSDKAVRNENAEPLFLPALEEGLYAIPKVVVVRINAVSWNYFA